MKERKKLNTVLLIVLGVLIIGIIIALVMLHNINKKNEAAFNAALNDYCVQKNLRISRDGDDFVVDIPGQHGKITRTVCKLFIANLFMLRSRRCSGITIFTRNRIIPL